MSYWCAGEAEFQYMQAQDTIVSAKVIQAALLAKHLELEAVVLPSCKSWITEASGSPKGSLRNGFRGVPSPSLCLKDCGGREQSLLQ